MRCVSPIKRMPALAGLFFFITLIFSINSVAQPVEKVKPGTLVITAPDITYYALEKDTLSSIAKQYTDKIANWEAIGKLNKIGNDRAIPIGYAILIPAELLPEEASQAQVVALAGAVTEKKKSGTETELVVGSIVFEGSLITTGKNGFVTFALPDESRVSIPSNSQVSLAKLRMTKFTKSPRTEIKLVQGRVESKVTPLEKNHGRFEVTSPLAIAGVRGTHFRVGINTNGIANEVLSGGVAVGQTAKPNALILPAGEGNIINATSVGKPVRLLPAPTLTQDLGLSYLPTLQFAVNTQTDAQAYRAQISRDAQAQNVLSEKMAQDLQFSFEGLDDGAYFARLTAIDSNGLEGLPSSHAFSLKAYPLAPFPLQPKHKVSTESIAFKWRATEAAKTYHLQVAKDTQFSQIVLDQADLVRPEFSIDSLAVGGYFWRIATVADKNGSVDQGPYSKPQSFTVITRPSIPAMREVADNQIHFSWASQEAQRYLVEVAQDPQFEKIILSKESLQANLHIKRPPDGTYYVRVRATDADRFIGPFSTPLKFELSLRWTTGSGDAMDASGGTVRASQ